MSHEVFFVPAQFDESAEVWSAKIRALYMRAGLGRAVAANDLVAIKTHFGERGNKQHLLPRHIRPLVDCVKAESGKPFLAETSTLYVGARSNAVDHVLLAHEHGFTIEAMGAPVIMLDGLIGAADAEVAVKGVVGRKASLAADALRVQSLIVASHVTGHCQAGLGGLTKNVAMGCASRKGKLKQHSHIKPRIAAKACVMCGLCVRWCPARAIAPNKRRSAMVIDTEACIGCGECVATCRQNAVESSFGTGGPELQRKMIEHVAALHHHKAGKIAYVNYLIRISKDCDCVGGTSPVRMPDVGVVAGLDPLAVERATLDLIEQHTGKGLCKRYWPDIDPTIIFEHGARVGLGTGDYTLTTIEV
jgi:uncharacterized protein